MKGRLQSWGSKEIQRKIPKIRTQAAKMPISMERPGLEECKVARRLRTEGVYGNGKKLIQREYVVIGTDLQ